MEPIQRFMDGPGPRVVVMVLAAGLFTSGVVLSFDGQTGGAIATYGASVFCLIFLFLTHFKRFNGFGIEAETWDEKMREAEDLINRLQSLSGVIAEPLFSMMARAGIWDSSIPRAEQYKIVRELDAELIKNGVPREKIEESKATWYRINMIRQSDPFYKHVRNRINEEIDAKRKEMNKIPQPISSDNHTKQRRIQQELRELESSKKSMHDTLWIDDWTKIPEELEARFESNPYFSDEEKNEIRERFADVLEDLHYYATYRNFRRLTVWLSESPE